MKTVIATIAAILLVTTVASAHAQVPDWVKTSAGWWADGTIPESEFLAGISFLIRDGIIQVSQPSTNQISSDSVPDWVKSSAGWWADGTISDEEFVNGIEHLMAIGLVSVSAHENNTDQDTSDPELAALEAEIEACSEITKAYKRLDCEAPIKQAITIHQYKQESEIFVLGPITYYWKGLGSEGNEFEISTTGQPLLSIRMLAENTSSEITALNCTSPSICNYDVWDGSKSYKYSGMDFTSGQIAINPGDAREFNILFGPNIGYGGTEFEYDSAKTYVFRISEDFGSASIPLPLE